MVLFVFCDGENSNHVFLGYCVVQFGRCVIVSWVSTGTIFTVRVNAIRCSEASLLTQKAKPSLVAED
jgi:hypothetical protein